MWRAWIIAAAILAGCAEFPEVDAALARGAPEAEFPALLPFEQLLTVDAPRLSDADDDAILARAAALKRRANALKRPVIDGPTRKRMDQGVTLP